VADDIMTAEQRSRLMSRIRGRDTGPELALRRALWARGVRYRVNHSIPGRPDIAFPKQRLAVFVDGCFWHGCPEHAVKPKRNARFWEEKLARNIRRDAKVNIELKQAGWAVLRFWEHQVECNVETCVEKVMSTLRRETEKMSASGQWTKPVG